MIGLYLRMAERRNIYRIAVQAQVTLRARDKSRVCAGTVKNIHLHGISVLCEERFSPGDVVDLEVIGRADRVAGTGPLTASLRVLRVEGDTPPFEVAGELFEVSLP